MERPKNPHLDIREVGIWRVIRRNSDGLFLHWSWITQASHLLYTHLHLVRCVSTLTRQVIAIAPFHLALYFLARAYYAVASIIGLYSSQILLDSVQAVVATGDLQAHVANIKFALALKFAHSFGWAFVEGFKTPAENTLKARVRALCGEKLLFASLTLDVSTLQRPEVIAQWKKTSQELPGDLVFSKLSSCWDNFFLLLEVLGQSGFMFNFLRTHEYAFLLTISCFLGPLSSQLLFRDMYYSNGVWYAYIINPDCLRLRSIDDILKTKGFQREIISGGLVDYFRSEYYKARKALGDMSTSEGVYEALYGTRFGGGLRSLLQGVLSNSPFHFQVFTILRNPASFSLTAMTLLQTASSHLYYTIWGLLNARKGFVQNAEAIRDYFDYLQRKSAVVDGTLDFEDGEKIKGMKIEFRNVSMKYPNSERLALDDVSFTINAGQTVLIVGENGSGKTTTVSLLARLWDCTGGTILINDRPIQDYKMQALREEQAFLRQDYRHFSSFTVAENIGIGLPERMDDMSRIRRAAEQGEAASVVAELEAKQLPGYDADLKPLGTKTRTGLEATSPLLKIYRAWEKDVELSGGQWQRLALARTFMRAPEASLICVDEPSAALDPRAEHGILSRLRELDGRTRIFITHRFGHLAKHADLILCLRNGRLVQSGTHDRLMHMEGEYQELYKIQALAFSSVHPHPEKPLEEQSA